MPTVFYQSLVDWSRVNQIVLLADQEDQARTRELIIKSLDHAVLDLILLELEQELHQEFLDLISEKYHDELVLDWLEEKLSPEIKAKLKNIISKTKSEIKNLLI